MGSLLALSRFIDRINEFVGRNVSWLVLAAVLISAGNATIRKMFDMSSNAWLEVQWYLFGRSFHARRRLHAAQERACSH